MDPSSISSAIGVVPDAAPTPVDLLAVALCWVLMLLLKRVKFKSSARKRSFRRAIPLLVIFLGVAVRTGVEAAMGGSEPVDAIFRGIVAGFTVTWQHNFAKATVKGEVDDGDLAVEKPD